MNEKLIKWKENSIFNLLTFGSPDVLYFEGHQGSMLRAKVGKRPGPAQQSESLIGFASLMSHVGNCLIGFLENGAVLKVKFNDKKLETHSSLSQMCHYCLSLFRDSTHLNRHTSKLHIGPVCCKICKSPREDLFEMKTHMKTCFYSCGVPGCELKHKR